MLKDKHLKHKMLLDGGDFELILFQIKTNQDQDRFLSTPRYILDKNGESVKGVLPQNTGIFTIKMKSKTSKTYSNKAYRRKYSMDVLISPRTYIKKPVHRQDTPPIKSD